MKAPSLLYDSAVGIIKHGGVKPNIIPAYTELEFYLRTPMRRDLPAIRTKAEMCFRSAAMATGCQVSIKCWVKSTMTTIFCVGPGEAMWPLIIQNIWDIYIFINQPVYILRTKHTFWAQSSWVRYHFKLSKNEASVTMYLWDITRSIWTWANQRQNDKRRGERKSSLAHCSLVQTSISKAFYDF